MSAYRSRVGFTLIEVAVTLAIVTVVVALAVPSMSRWAENERLAASARSVDAALAFARSEAIRKGSVHLVFIGTDAGGNTLVGPDGNDVDLLVVDDGPPGTAGQNCIINGGEASLGVDLERGVSFGASDAPGPVPTDPGLANINAGTTFADAGGNAANWLMFRPDGPPLRFSAGCVTSPVGTGGGGVYLTNGKRDKAVVLTPLGSTRTHSWIASGPSWTT